MAPGPWLPTWRVPSHRALRRLRGYPQQRPPRAAECTRASPIGRMRGRSRAAPAVLSPSPAGSRSAMRAVAAATMGRRPPSSPPQSSYDCSATRQRGAAPAAVTSRCKSGWVGRAAALSAQRPPAACAPAHTPSRASRRAAHFSGRALEPCSRHSCARAGPQRSNRLAGAFAGRVQWTSWPSSDSSPRRRSKFGTMGLGGRKNGRIHAFF